MAKSAKRGALATDPKFQVAKDPKALKAQFERAQAEIKKRGGAANAPGWSARLEQIQAAMGGGQATIPSGEVPPGEQGPQGPSLNSVNQTSLGGMDNFMNQMQSQGAFNPGSFDQMQQRAQDSVMNNFNRQMNPIFSQQSEDFQQRMAERGVSENSEAYQREYAQLQNSQNNARQNAIDQSFATGLGAQGQAFNQASTQYQMPAQMLGAYAPFYAGQSNQAMQTGQQQFLGSQADLDRQHQEDMARQQYKYNMNLQAAAPRGGGGGGGQMSMADRFALMDRELYNNMILNGAQNLNGQPQGGMSNGIAQGLGLGVGSMIGGMLK